MQRGQTSIVNSFAVYVMRGRREAMVVAIITALLPFLSWISLVVICLVTLRKGAKEGALVLAAALLPMIVLSWYLFTPLLVVENIVFGYLMTWLLACVLRSTASWSYVIEVAGLLGLVTIVMVHIIAPDIQQIYARYLLDIFNKINTAQSNPMQAVDAKQYIDYMARFMTGMQGTLYIVGNLLNLGLARWMQAKLYNPGGFSKEITLIRLSGIAGVIMIVSILGSMAGWGVVSDCLLIVFLIYIIAAISLIHYLARTRAQGTFYLIGFYVAVVVFLPFSLLPLLVLSFVDIWADLRKKLVILKSNQ